VVGHDDVTADLNVVRDVGVSQDVIVRPDPRDAAFVRGAMNRDVFAEGVAVADFRARDTALPLQILGLQPEAGEREGLILLPQFRVPIDDDVRMELAPLAQFDVWTDDAIRTDLAVLADAGFRMDDGGGMNHLDCGLRIADRGSRWSDCGMRIGDRGLGRDREVRSEATTMQRSSLPSAIRLAIRAAATFFVPTRSSI